MVSTIGKIEWHWLAEGKEEQLFQRIEGGDLANYIVMDMLENPAESEKIFDIASDTREGCHGYLVFNNEEAQEAIDRDLPYIYYVGNIPYGFEPYLRNAEAAICYCFSFHVLTKVRNHKFYYGMLEAEKQAELQKEKDRMVTVSPRDGGVFKGKNQLISQKPLDNLYIKNLLEYIKKYVSRNPEGFDTIKAWMFIDIIFNIHISPYDLKKKYHMDSKQKYPCLFLPEDKVILFDVKGLDYNISEFLTGVIASIKRVMGSEIPASRHYQYYRPLFDPMDYITAEEYEIDNERYIDYIQMTGLEFYDLNQYSKKYDGIYSIKIFFHTQINYWEYRFNFLDYSNPNGADLILNSLPYRNILLYINDNKIDKNNIIPAFSEIRNREFEFYRDRERFDFTVSGRNSAPVRD